MKNNKKIALFWFLVFVILFIDAFINAPMTSLNLKDLLIMMGLEIPLQISLHYFLEKEKE